MKAILFFGLAVMAAFLLFGCTQYSSPNQTPGAGTASSQVSIQNMSFSPSNIQVAAGTTVTWTNNDTVTHTVTSDTGAFDSGNLSPGQTYTHTFSTAGTYTYHCSIHTSMHGIVTAQ